MNSILRRFKRLSPFTQAAVLIPVVFLAVKLVGYTVQYYTSPRIYGRIVDERGVPIEDAAVTFACHYANFYRPADAPERFRYITVETDADGDFCVRGIDGSNVRMERVTLDDRELIQVRPVPPGTEYHWSLLNHFSLQSMPQTSKQRITYSFKR